MALGEFDLIARIRARAAARADVVLGIGDDAALLAPRPGECLALCVDTLNAGVHFPPSATPADIGWKALAVNLSDLAAMGAEPAWCTLSLSLPQPDRDWLDGFLDGLLALAGEHGLALVGGDTTRGPLSVSITAAGFVPPTQALRRDGARAGDEIWVTGTLGDAAAGLALVQAEEGGNTGAPGFLEPPGAETGPAHRAFLRGRLHRPAPRIAAGLALRGLAHACIDVSDGLLADLGHVLAASAVGAVLELDALPASPALAALRDPVARRRFQCSGGDDYELCFTAPPARHEAVRAALSARGVQAACIGSIRAGSSLVAQDAQGRAVRLEPDGFDHFRDAIG